MTFDFEEWSATDQLFEEDDDLDRGAAAQFVNPDWVDNFLYDELKMIASSLRGVISPQSPVIRKRNPLV